MTTYEKAEKFIYRNARPLELARWQYRFENGSAEHVLRALSAYQNADGGFGHALEADCFSPASSPIQTWAAAEILREIDVTDAAHPMIQGILRYLESGADFDEEKNQWLNTVPANNDAPHAVWWEYKEGAGEFQYNPTAHLAGFIVRFAERGSALYQKGCEIVRQAFAFFIKKVPFDESHITSCFLAMYEYCKAAGVDFIDMKMFREKLEEQIRTNICTDTQKWHAEYVAKPSKFITSKDCLCYKDFAELVKAECDFLISAQLADGSYPVPWEWCTNYKEFTLAENWWKSVILLENMSFLKEFAPL